LKDDGLFWLLIAGLALATVGGVAYVAHTRGFRNNNPGNLKYGTPWKGVVGVDPKGFAIFDTMENGVRALGKDLTAKQNRGLNTIREIIYVYAPPSDNNPTPSYVNKVAEWVGIGPDDVLIPDDLPALISAVIRFENGKTLDPYTINAGIRAMAA
jgi:hypothetical protein